MKLCKPWNEWNTLWIQSGVSFNEGKFNESIFIIWDITIWKWWGRKVFEGPEATIQDFHLFNLNVDKKNKNKKMEREKKTLNLSVSGEGGTWFIKIQNGSIILKDSWNKLETVKEVSWSLIEKK